ncbi:hypothetical protein BJ912DRAFT_967633 [Pholiota molesta]|nr:hypothetical protein BJ912DRAFT_967633 [Pholiota molesta]
MAPFLRLDIKNHYGTQDRLLAEDGMAFLLKYITSAQYLQVDADIWEHIHDRLMVGDQVTFPFLHTLETGRQDGNFMVPKSPMGIHSFDFNLDDEYDSEGYIELPAKDTHPRLSTLFLTGGGHSTDDTAIPLTWLFRSLHLPALQMLTLLSWADSWEEPHTISDICTMLRSTPALTTLALHGEFFLSLYKTDYPTIIATLKISNRSGAMHLT